MTQDWDSMSFHSDLQWLFAHWLNETGTRTRYWFYTFIGLDKLATLPYILGTVGVGHFGEEKVPSCSAGCVEHIPP